MKGNGKIPIVLGFSLAGIGALIIVLAGNYQLGSRIFAGGFLLTVVYVVGATLLTSSENLPKSKIFVGKLVAFGFGLAAVPSTIGVFFLGVDDSDVMIFVNSGIAIVVVGLVINLFFVLGSHENGV